MLISGPPTRTIWRSDAGCGDAVEIIDQTRLPHEFVVQRLTTLADAVEAIAVMRVRGAPLIGATAAFGLALAASRDVSDSALHAAAERLIATRPTAVNLCWAVQRMLARRSLGRGRSDLRGRRGAEPCHRPAGSDVVAGWLATVDWGTALAPIFAAQQAGLDVHVWVDETRPRNQGASLTAWELKQAGIAHHVIAGGHLMQHGEADICIVGTDRTAANGDVCNKIGTYLKALAAFDNGVPFYVAAPGPSIDFTLADGGRIPIEERDATEVACIQGRDDSGRVVSVRLTPEGSPAANPAFDVTPARLVSGLITERGICAANRSALAALYPERNAT